VSGFRQTTAAMRCSVPTRGGRVVADLMLYGLDEAGETAFSEPLRLADRSELRGVAEARLRQWPAVEVWEGPLCVLRLRRRPALAGD